MKNTLNSIKSENKKYIFVLDGNIHFIGKIETVNEEAFTLILSKNSSIEHHNFKKVIVPIKKILYMGTIQDNENPFI